VEEGRDSYKPMITRRSALSGGGGLLEDTPSNEKEKLGFGGNENRVAEWAP